MPRAILHTDGYVQWWCPGCRHQHVVNFKPVEHRKDCWEFNGDMNLPTITPSVRHFYVKTHGEDGKALKKPSEVTTCHYFIKKGTVEFLTDCKHMLVGQTVPLPELNPDGVPSNGR